MSPDRPIILFDGVCNLCIRAVQFIIKRDKKKQFLFASLQGQTGQELLRKFNLPADKFHSLLLIEGDKSFTHSTATLRIARRFQGPWKLLYGFIIVPKFIRNAIYRWVSRNRYQWFGKQEECMVPTPALKERFLD